MADQRLTAVFDAVDTISQTLERVGQSVDSLKMDFAGLDQSMSGTTVSSQATQTQIERLGSTINDLEGEIGSATRSLANFIGVQNVNIATAATNAGAMELAAHMIDEAGDEALKTAGQMGVLSTIMDELSLSGSALSVNIGAFNVSLRNLAPLVPIAASMGTLVTVAGALVVALGNLAVAFAGIVTGGALAFLEDMEENMEGVSNKAEALEAIMGGLRDLFIQALEPLNTMANKEFFVNVVEGIAGVVHVMAQAIEQTRDTFMPLFSELADIAGREFDNLANAVETSLEMMGPVIVNFFDWFMRKLPDAIRFMSRVTADLAGPMGNLGDSLLAVLTSIIETATRIFQGLAPAFSLALDIIAELVDVLNVLGNGFLQAAIFIGVLSLAVTKFVGIADVLANIGISAANTLRQWGSSATSVSSATSALNRKLGNQFKHLSALGKILTRQMTVYEASGQKMKDLKERIQDIAQAIQDAEREGDNLRDTLVQIQTAAEAGGFDAVEDEVQDLEDQFGETNRNISKNSDEIDDVIAGLGDDVSRSMDDAADSVQEVDLSEFSDEAAESSQIALESFEDFDPDVSRFRGANNQFAALDDVAVDANTSLMRTGDAMEDAADAASGFGGELADNQATMAAFPGLISADEVIGPFDPDNVPDMRTDDVARGLAIDDMKPSKLGQTFNDAMFDRKFQNAMVDDIPTVDARDKFIADADDVDTTNIDRIGDAFSGVRDRASSALSGTGNLLSGAGRRFAEFSNNVAARVNSFGSSVKEAFMVAGGAIREGTQLAVTKFKTMGGVTGIAQSAFGRLRSTGTSLAGTLRGVASSALTAGLQVLSAGLQSMAASAGFIAAEFSSKGAAAGLKAMAMSAWGAVKSLGSAATAAVAAAATFITTLIPASITAGTAINIAFAGIPAILAAIAVAAGLVVGVLGNMSGITSSLKGAFDGLKSALKEIGGALMDVGVPAWNLMVDIVEAALSPFLAIWDGIKMVGEALGIMGGEGEGVGSVIGLLIDGFGALMSAVGAVLNFVAPVFTVIGDLIYAAFITPFRIVAGVIHLVINIFQTLFEFLMENVPFLSEFVGILVDGFNRFIDIVMSIPDMFMRAFEAASQIVDDVMSFIMDMVEPVVNMINDVIEASNTVLGTDFNKLTVEREGRDVSEALAGAKTSAEEAREGMARDEEEPEDDVTTEPTPEFNFEDKVENNVEVDADPEDQAQLSRITKDAIEEANSFARRQQGGQ